MSTSSSAPEAPPSNLWPLLSVIAAILMWLGADILRERVLETEAQITAASARMSRGSLQEITKREDEVRQLEAKRQSLAQRLASGETEQMTRAKLVFELRQKCNAVPVVCQIRLADLSNAESSRQRSSATNEEPDLEALGISRARAVLSGSFKSGELLGLYSVFAQDESSQWKVNALLVKGNSFELDVERLVMRQVERVRP